MNSLQKYKASFIVGLVNSMEYRFEFFMNILSTVFPIILQVFLWTTMYRNSAAGSMYGYTFPQMIMYVVVAGAVSKFSSTGIEEAVNEDIHTGSIAKYITKPVSYVMFRLTGIMGEKFSSMIIMVSLTIVSLFTLHFAVGFEINGISTILFLPSLLLAAVLNYYLFFCISMLAFWFTEIGSFFHTIKVLIMILSGGVFPISVFGKTFLTVSRLLPLSYTISFPIQILAGSVEMREIMQIIGIQIIWIIILAVLSNVLWESGIKKYVAVGG